MNTKPERTLEQELRTSIASCLLGERFTHDVTSIADIVAPHLMKHYVIFPKYEPELVDEDNQ